MFNCAAWKITNFVYLFNQEEYRFCLTVQLERILILFNFLSFILLCLAVQLGRILVLFNCSAGENY